MKSTGELVVDATLRHSIQSRGYHFQRLLVTCASAVVDEQIENRRMGKLRRRPEPAVLRVKALDG